MSDLSGALHWQRERAFYYAVTIFADPSSEIRSCQGWFTTQLLLRLQKKKRKKTWESFSVNSHRMLLLSFSNSVCPGRLSFSCDKVKQSESNTKTIAPKSVGYLRHWEQSQIHSPTANFAQQTKKEIGSQNGHRNLGQKWLVSPKCSN